MKLNPFYFYLLLLGCISCNSIPDGKIDRKAVVDRHKIVTTVDIPRSPAQVGNGEFAFGTDITGLQTFSAHYTMSHWSWHSFPLPEELKIYAVR